MWSSNPANRAFGSGLSEDRGSIIPPSKNWRYIAQPRPEVSSPLVSQHSDDEAEAEYQATQPSTSLHMAATGTVLGGAPPPEERVALASPITLDGPLRESALRQSLDSSDFIPDSEATPLAHSLMSPEIPLPTPPKSKGDQRRLQAARSDDFVPDSLELPEGEKSIELESELDVPLAASKKGGRVQAQTKGAPTSGGRKKLANAAVAPPQPKLPVIAEEPTTLPGPSNGKPSAAPPSKTKRAESEVVPSSHPIDDEPIPAAPPPKKRKSAATTRVKKGKGKGKGKGKSAAAVKAPVATEPPPVTPVRAERALRPRSTAGTSRIDYRETSDEDEDSDVEREQSAAPTVPLSDTVDDDMDVGSSTSRKRKRGVSESAKSTRSFRGGSKAARMVSESPAPSASKKRKSGHVRVLALWKKERTYYLGSITRPSTSPGYYHVDFDDGYDDDVQIDDIRRGELRVGDVVLFGPKEKKAAITDISQVAAKRVTVELEAAPHTVYVISFAEVKVHGRTAAGSVWEDRKLTEDDLAGFVTRKAPKLFERTAFVLTYSPVTADIDAKKRELTGLVKSQGGLVLKDWMQLFSLDGDYSSTNRWSIRKEDVRLRDAMKGKVNKVFLVSDDTSTKARFLIALALGIPCLDVQWLYDVIAKVSDIIASMRNSQLIALAQGNDVDDVDWRRYLLPAGTALRARVSQLVDLDWGIADEHVTEIMANRLPAKPFEGMTILCYGQDFVPRKAWLYPAFVLVLH